MSLAFRILLIVLLLNLAVVGGVQVALYWAQRERLRQDQESYLQEFRRFVSILSDVYSPERLTGTDEQVRDLLKARGIRDVFSDLWVTSGRPASDAFVHLNPRGAVHRDPDRFPRRTILAGLERARNERGLIEVADGYCMAIRRANEVVGSLWFLPVSRPAAPALPFWPTAAAVVLGTALFGLLLYGVVRRTVKAPLQRIGEAAAAVGAGRYDVQVPEPRGMRELSALVQSFNAMARKVGGHTEELEREVARAVADARQREQALVLSSRLAAVGTLAAGIAHEINNPIGGMLNAVNRLLAATDLDERERRYLGLIQDGLQRVARTARKVLDFSPRSIEPRAFTLASAVEAARALVDHRLQRQGVRLTVTLAEALPRLYGDPHEIQQVLLNLFLNSLDALEGAQHAGQIRVLGSAADGRVLVEVIDDGPGMDPADVARAMDPFFSRKERPDASGLGLFICYSIVRNHGGEIAVESEPGKGFRVRLELPAADAAARRPADGAG